MPELTQSLLLQSLDEWGRYAEAYRRLPLDEQAAFLKEQGFASLQTLLVHVAAWWEEASGIIRDAVEDRERPPHKYDLDAFNAASLQRFRDRPEPEVLTWYEAQRRQMVVLVSSLTDEQLKIGRVSSWLDGVILEHLKEHGVSAPRFLTIDMLQREWAGCVRGFMALPEEERFAFLQKQGFARFRDLIAHVMGWWEEGIGVIQTSSDAAVCDVEDVDAFNAEAVRRFGKLPESEVFAAYETTRLRLIDLIQKLPDEVMSKHNIQDWLMSDVIRHYFEHAR